MKSMNQFASMPNELTWVFAKFMAHKGVEIEFSRRILIGKLYNVFYINSRILLLSIHIVLEHNISGS
ncbi:hypothetical protein RIR_jg29107.t1 [Rhizophagus irregularis DAOM 181602=DAOM 197198]|nr:hypothetical protein RIR_jg29107.t1 [Rhizophagus irregularis DAOM 181602=DAOM 197198]